MVETIIETTGKIPMACLGLAIFITLSLIIDFMIRKVKRRFDDDTGEIFRLISNSQKGVFLLIGVIVAISALGFNITTLITGLGLTGFALGFALKDAISNLLADAMIGLYKPFKIGDTIDIVAAHGEVIDLNFRYITIKTTEGKCLIPNSLVIKNKLTIIEANSQN